MFIEGLGGIRIFSVEIEKEKQFLEVVYQYLNQFGKEVKKNKFLLYFDKKANIIKIEDEQFCKDFKKEVNDFLDIEFNFKSQGKKPHIESFKNNIDNSVVEFSLNKRKHKINIEWENAKDIMKNKAPNVPGDYFIGTEINSFVFSSYLSSLINAKDELGEVAGKMSLLLFFENIEQQRFFHVIRVLSGLYVMEEMIGEVLFEEVHLSKNIDFDGTEVKFEAVGSVDRYSFEFDLNVIAEIEGKIFELIKNGEYNLDGLFGFFSKMDDLRGNIFDFYLYEAKDTNDKSLKDLVVVDLKNDIEKKEILSIRNIKNYIGKGNNLRINEENLEFEEILTPEEMIENKVFVPLSELVNFIEKTS